MLARRPDDIEAFEAVSRDGEACRILLRMSALSRGGLIPRFLEELGREPGIDDETKGQLTEIARDRSFLLAIEEYLCRTHRIR